MSQCRLWTLPEVCELVQAMAPARGVCVPVQAMDPARGVCVPVQAMAPARGTYMYVCACAVYGPCQMSVSLMCYCTAGLAPGQWLMSPLLLLQP